MRKKGGRVCCGLILPAVLKGTGLSLPCRIRNAIGREIGPASANAAATTKHEIVSIYVAVKPDASSGQKCARYEGASNCDIYPIEWNRTTKTFHAVDMGTYHPLLPAPSSAYAPPLEGPELLYETSNIGGARTPTVSLNGEFLAYNKGRDIYVIDLSTCNGGTCTSEEMVEEETAWPTWLGKDQMGRDRLVARRCERRRAS